MKLKLLLWKTLIAGMVALVGFTDFPVTDVVSADLPVQPVVSSYATPGALLTADIKFVRPTPKPKIVVIQSQKKEPKILSQKVKIEPPIADCVMQFPVAAKTRLSRGFSGKHTGMDISYASYANKYLPIVAAAPGKVVEAKQSGWNGGYGNVVVIDHGNGYMTRYGHNSKVLVKVGQEVKAGDQIAVMGKTGRVYGQTGIHLHFEVLKNGQRINPNLCLK